VIALGIVRKRIMERKASYVFGWFLLLIGVIGIFGSLGITYLDSIGYWGAPKDFMLSIFLNRGSEEIGFGIQGVQLFHYLLAGLAISAIGGTLLGLRRGIISVVEEVAVTLKCSSCKKKWEESLSKMSLKSMEYPKVRIVSRRKCPECAKFTRPHIINVKGFQ
jgi:hypothetical protein